MLSRRTFIGWIGAVGAALGLRRRAEARPGPRAQGSSLDPVTLTRLGEAILPAELGDAGIARVSRAFVQWLGAYRAGAELVHGYGTAQIRQTGPSPAIRWRDQLAELDGAARRAHGSPFASLSVTQRRALVEHALAEDRSGRLPDPIAARHVAVALLAWYFASPDATNLCYRARVDANACRPLGASAREPLPLLNGGPGIGASGLAATDAGPGS